VFSCAGAPDCRDFALRLEFQMTLHFILGFSEFVLINDTVSPIHRRRFVSVTRMAICSLTPARDKLRAAQRRKS
jgi:hypothetical protein